MKPLKHQLKALQWATKKKHFPCFMEMRTGKSLVAINQVKQWGGKVLLIAPISTWYDWEHLLGSLGIYSITLSGTTKQKQSRLDQYGEVADWLIVNPEGVSRWGKDFFEAIAGLFDICILDESVFIKNPKAKITKLLLKYAPMFLHKMVMTGTPIAEQTQDVVCQMLFCNGHFMGHTNFYKWRLHYMYPGKFGWHLKKGVAPLIRDELKRDSFVLSAKDAGMFVQQVKQTQLVEMPTELRKDYAHIEKHWRLETESTKYGVVKDIWLAQLASGVYSKPFGKESVCFKAPAVKALCDGELRGQQVIVFSRWVKETYAVARQLDCPLITGNTPYDARKDLLREYRQGKFQYLVMQSKTACRGLDLSCCDNAIICSNYWQYEIRKQIQARMNHPHRTVPTLIVDMIAKDTIEEKVYDLLQRKHINARFFLQRLKAKVK